MNMCDTRVSSTPTVKEIISQNVYNNVYGKILEEIKNKIKTITNNNKQ